VWEQACYAVFCNRIEGQFILRFLFCCFGFCLTTFGRQTGSLQSSATMMIGNHQLEGVVETLKKPLVVLNKVRLVACCSGFSQAKNLVFLPVTCESIETWRRHGC
jgi:hypothetical protein